MEIQVAFTNGVPQGIIVVKRWKQHQHFVTSNVVLVNNNGGCNNITTLYAAVHTKCNNTVDGLRQ